MPTPPLPTPAWLRILKLCKRPTALLWSLEISAVSQTAITTAYLTLELQVKGKNEECACEAFYQVYLSIKKDPAIQVQSGERGKSALVSILANANPQALRQVHFSCLQISQILALWLPKQLTLADPSIPSLCSALLSQADSSTLIVVHAQTACFMELDPTKSSCKGFVAL